MTRNKRMVNLFSEKDYANFLSNKASLQRWIDEKKVSMLEGSNITMRYQVRLDALDNYILNLVETNQTHKLNRQDLLDYLNMVYQNRDNLYFFRNCLLLSYPYAEMIYSGKMLENIRSRGKALKTAAQKIYEELMQKGKVAEADMNKLLVYLIGALGKESDKISSVIDNVFNYLLVKDSNGEQLTYKENFFMLRVMSYYSAKELGIPYTSVYLTNDDFGGNQLRETGMGASYDNYGIIYINKRAVESRKQSNPNLTSLQYFLMVIGHENRHSYQSYNISQAKPDLAIFETIKSDLFRKHLSSSSFDEYHINYRFNGMEDDANAFGYRFLRETLNKGNIKNTPFHNEIDSSLIRLQYKQSLGRKKNQQQMFSAEMFDVKTLIEIIRKNPDYLNKYPMLRIMFNDNGTPKNMTELFNYIMRPDGRFDPDKFAIAKDFILRVIDMNLDNTNIVSLDYVSQIQLFTLMFDTVYSELKKLKNSMDILDTEIGVFDRINRTRIDRLDKYIDVLNKHSGLIEHLASLDRFGELGRSLWISKRFINETIYSVKKRLDESDKFDESQIYAELEALSGSEVIASGRRV